MKARYSNPAAPGIMARNPFTLDGDVVSMQISQDQTVIFDLEDLPLVAGHRWSADKGGNTYYAQTDIVRPNGKYMSLKMHRLLLPTTPDKPFVDHKDGSGLCNLKSNLRACSPKENRQNSRSVKNSSSAFKGVYLYKNSKKWVARIRVNDKPIHLGMFACEVCAARAYDAAARLHIGDFAYLNFPDEQFA